MPRLIGRLCATGGRGLDFDQRANSVRGQLVQRYACRRTAGRRWNQQIIDTHLAAASGTRHLTDSNINSDFQPTANWNVLGLRASLLRRIRTFFDERNFLEVETPLLSADTVADLHLDPIPVTLFADSRNPTTGRSMWLQTSPEFAMKRLLASGGRRLYQITKAFRGGEAGQMHNPEFTILEWYRVGDDLQAGIELLSELAQETLGLGKAEAVTYEDAFLQHVGIHPHTATRDQLVNRARELDLRPPETLHHRDEWLNYLLAEKVEPNLGVGHPTILYDYPASQAALAQVRDVTNNNDNQSVQYQVAERFELYVNGVELANGYHELLDPNVLVERNRTANAIRRADGRYEVPEESRLLAAMRNGLPECCGVALGVDRLVMVAAGAKSLAEVMAFPIDRA